MAHQFHPSISMILFCLVPLALVASCTTSHEYIGKVFACDGTPTADATVEAWKNQLIPLSLPIMVTEARTDVDGGFNFETDEKVSFLVYSGEQIDVVTHPGLSDSKCVVSE